MHFYIYRLIDLFLKKLLAPLQALLEKRVFSVDRIGGAEMGAGLASLHCQWRVVPQNGQSYYPKGTPHVQQTCIAVNMSMLVYITHFDFRSREKWWEECLRGVELASNKARITDLFVYLECLVDGEQVGIH